MFDLSAFEDGAALEDADVRGFLIRLVLGVGLQVVGIGDSDNAGKVPTC